MIIKENEGADWIDATTENDIQRLLAEQFDKYMRHSQKVVGLVVERYEPGNIITYRILVEH